MITRIYYVFYFSIIVFWEQSTQQVIPVENYHMYHPMYRNIPITIPVAIHPINQCDETVRVQNCITSQPSLAPMISENINRILINKILSYPGIQTIFDPKSKIFNTHGIDTIKSEHSTTPNVINNFFIVPLDCFKSNENNIVPFRIKKSGKIENTKKKNIKKITTHKSNDDQRQITENPNENIDILFKNKQEDYTLAIKENKEVIEESKKNKRKRKNETLTDVTNLDLDIFQEINLEANLDEKSSTVKNNTKSKKRSNRKKIESEDLNIQTNNITDKALEDANERDGTKNIKQPKLSVVPIKKDIKIKPKEKGKTTTNNRKNNYSQQDKIIKDYKKQFPNVPEYILRHMLPFMNNQFQNPAGFNYYNNLFPFNFDQLYQQHQKMNTNSDTKKNNRRKNRNRKTKRRNYSKSQNFVKEANVKVIPIDEDVSSIEEWKSIPDFITTESLETLYEDIGVTTDNINNYEELYQAEFGTHDIKSTTTDLKGKLEVNDYEEVHSEEDKGMIIQDFEIDNTEYNQESINDFEIENNLQQNNKVEFVQLNLKDKEEGLNLPELGNEDTVPTIYENVLIEDYYPIFTDSEFHSNNDRYYIKDITDRHFYSTDRSENDKRLERFANFRPLAVLRDQLYNTEPIAVNKFNTGSIAEVRDKIFNDIKKEAIGKIANIAPMFNIEADVDEFRASEFPGFVTRKVNKDAKDDKFVDEKSSIYSNFKTPLYNILIKPENKKVIANPGIETVYAPSKVIKYGHEAVTSSVNLDNDQNISYVMAESIDYPEPFR